MRSKEVLKILKITRPTLTSYVKNGKIRAVLQPNNFYDYNEDDVLKLAGLSPSLDILPRLKNVGFLAQA